MTSWVIPVAEEPTNPTLPLALWSVGARAPWAEPVLVGREFALLPYLTEYPFGRIIDFPHQDPFDAVKNTTAMLRAACESDKVTDPFVWSNDDIYVLDTVTIDDVAVVSKWALGDLAALNRHSYYGRKANDTFHLLRDRLRRPTFNYELHVPLLVDKNRMLDALTYESENPRSVYGNLVRPAPGAIVDDVKAAALRDLDPLLAREPRPRFFSTGKSFPPDPIRRALGL